MDDTRFWTFATGVLVGIIAGLSPVALTAEFDAGRFEQAAEQTEAVAEPFLFTDPGDVMVFIGAVALVVSVVVVVGLLDGLYQQRGESE